MKKLVAVSVTAMALIAAAPASADKPTNPDCVGEIFNELAAPGFGQAVSEMAQQGGFDDYIRLICRNG
jgi:hypothetical protein